jgi:glutathione-regulated potassium-efflux system protein KefB
METQEPSIALIQVVALLAAGVIAVPIFRKLKLGTVLGYFAAGLVIGPHMLGLFNHPQAILHIAEFGVIMLLFIIGLEMDPKRLWLLRRHIFGLGFAQVSFCGGLLTLAGYMAGLPLATAFVAGMGFVLSSTAVVMQLLDEFGETSTPQGQKAFSILLFEDLMIVPLLAIVALIAPSSHDSIDWQKIAIGVATIAAFIAGGRWLLNPIFRILANAHAREVMTAAALLVVLGASLIMELNGLSMAMGAFLAGVLLSESSFRHQLEAEIEPFRGILLGLFFLAIGMSIDLPVIEANWEDIAITLLSGMCISAVGIFTVARIFGDSTRAAITRVSLFTQGGEFAFVLYGAASISGILTPTHNAIFTAVVVLSMAITPLIAQLVHRLMHQQEPSMDGIEHASGLDANVLLIGFGRFGQVVSQNLLARGFNVSIIESDVEMIRVAATFGFKVYYGDGTHLNVLHAAGAAKAEMIIIATDNKAATDRIVDLAKNEFPLTKLFVRAFDRGHAMDLIRRGVDYQLRETFESAMKFGEDALKALGVPDAEAADIADDVRRRDLQRLELQVAGDITSGRYLMRGNAPIPTPLTKPKREGKVHDEKGDTVSAEELEEA